MSVEKRRPLRVLGDRILDILREQMEERGVTQGDLGDAVGLSQSTISRTLSGRRDLCLDELTAMCDRLSLDPLEVVLGGERRIPAHARRFTR